jgi:hypothetical protein
MAFDPTQHFTDLRGKKYLETKWRLVWFREEHPNGIIATELLQTEPVMIIKATIYAQEGEVLATGHGMCAIAGGKVYSGRELEKAETAAIGRALAHAGYGTQFTEEDEMSSLADSPVERRPNSAPQKSVQGSAPGNSAVSNSPAQPKASTAGKVDWAKIYKMADEKFPPHAHAVNTVKKLSNEGAITNTMNTVEIIASLQRYYDSTHPQPIEPDDETDVDFSDDRAADAAEMSQD